MIDIFTCISKEADHTSKSFEQTILFLVNQGVRAIAVDDQFDKLGDIRGLNLMLKSNNIPLEIMRGGRFLLTEKLFENGKRNFSTINNNSKYALFYARNQDTLSDLENVIYRLQLDGIVPIISEPELHDHFVANKSEIYKLVKKGALIQLSSDSLIGKNGKKAKQAAKQFLNHNLVHVIASGFHLNAYHNYSLPQAYETIEKIYGKGQLNFFVKSALSIIEGKAVVTTPPERVKKSKFLRIF